MNSTALAFVVFALCLVLITIHYCAFSRDARATRRYLDEQRRKRSATIPFDVPSSRTDKRPSPNKQDVRIDDRDDESKKGDGADDDDDFKSSNGEEQPPTKPDYPNDLLKMESSVVAPERLYEYRLLATNDDADAAATTATEGTGLYDDWLITPKSYRDMFVFQNEILRFVATDSNNAIGTIDAYVRCVAVSRDFAQRFLHAVRTGTPRVVGYDWRAFVITALEHFARCLYFAKDASVRNVSVRCFDAIARDPYDLYGRSFERVDPMTAYRAANAWILTKRTIGRGNWGNNENYRRMLMTLAEKSSPSQQWLYYEPPKIDTVTRLRDGGRLLQGRVPFYGDLWHRYVYIRNVRKMDDRVDTLVESMNEFACLRLLVHTQVRYASFGLFGPGLVVPSYWLWPSTEVGLAVIPSIGFLRMYEQRYSWCCRIFKKEMPYYTYRTGRFDPINMHVFSQNRMFVLLGDEDIASRAGYQPGCIVVDNETERWVLEHSVASHEAGDMIALYPLRASGTVMATRSIGVMVQRYEMFRDLVVDEWVLLDRENKRMYTHVTIRNDTDRAVSYYTSSRVEGTVRRIPAGSTMTVYAYADFDDSQLTSRILCKPMDIQAFFGQSQEESVYTSFLDDGKIYYHLSAEDGPDHVYAISRDDMVDIPEKFTVRGRNYAYDVGLNQYVKITGRVRPHDVD